MDFSGYEFVNDDDDDEDNENAISLEKLKQDVMGPLEPELDFDRGLTKSPLLGFIYFKSGKF